MSQATNAVSRLTQLTGSDLPHLGHAITVGTPDPKTTVQLTVVLRADSDSPQPRTLDEHSRLSFAERTGSARRAKASASDLGRLRAWAAEHQLSEVSSMLGGLVVRLDGELRNAEAALNVEAVLIEDAGEAVLGFRGSQSLPEDLAPAVVAVLGLDGRQCRPQARTATDLSVSYNPPDVATIYQFPNSHGSGQTIGIIELGGGYVASDLDSYFQSLGVPQTPAINAMTVSGPGNSPGGGADGEVCLDIEIAASIAYEATINVYFGQGWGGQVAGIAQAIEDGCSVVTSSWGSNWESSFSLAQRIAMDFVLLYAADANVTVLHGANDRGSWGTKGQSPTSGNCAAHAPYPPTSPWITACGGTSLRSSSEVVWNDTSAGSINGGGTGGGVSSVYAVPSYQSNAGINPVSVNPNGGSGRGIPDVASVADPATGYNISINGTMAVIGGDSATGPLWAALVAILNEQLGSPVGFLNPTLYGELEGSGFNDITSGDNAYYYGSVTVPGYDAAVGWDACTGYGSPNGNALLAALQALAAKE